MISEAQLINLARAAPRDQPSDDDALAFMGLLHTHRLGFQGAHLDDQPGETTFAALTQRHSATIIAAAWPSKE